MTDFTIFYSWQSDLPNNTNRKLIGEALRTACETVALNSEINESPRVDQDTQGTAGAVEIPAVIMQKIDVCQVFVADVSICYRGDVSGRLSPNPNVLFELGYAVARLGWDRVILVLNEASGTINQLPFDLDKRRTLLYAAQDDQAQARKHLTEQLVGSITAVTKLPSRVGQVLSIADQTIEAIETKSPTRKKLIRNFGAWVVDQLAAVEIDADDPNDFVARLDQTLPVLASMWSVCEAIEVTESPTLFVEFFEMFQAILERYDVRPETGKFEHRTTTFDWWKFHGNELMLLPVAALLRGNTFDELREFLNLPYIQKHWNDKGVQGNFDFRSFSDHLPILDYWNDKRSRKIYNPQAHLMKDRLTNYAPAGAGLITEADLVLSLISSIRPDTDFRKRWYPELCFFDKNAPRLLSLATREAEALKIAPLFESKGIAELQAKLRDGFAKLNSLRSKHDHRSFDFETEINSIAARV